VIQSPPACRIEIAKQAGRIVVPAPPKIVAGVATRAAAAAGSLLLVLMWTAVLPPENNVFLDDHLIYALLLVVLALTGAGRTLGLGTLWEKLPFVQERAYLR
jgi:thiosulfate dehydrogenase [quinone] large subunit